MDEIFMKEALFLAEKAFSLGEVPVGAVIVRNGTVIGRGFNQCEAMKNPLLHAEIVAIEEAVSVVGDWRLTDCEMYVTLEPCAMCSGAIINSRIKTVYIAAKDSIYGSMGSVCSLQYYFPEKPKTIYGLCEEESKKVLSDFFKILRKG
ncbi:MAG: nucleoside deaminase [Ruminococcaceae bacterium]|nr:nucleoside deaminase [Oscillospiraceae bacterium]